MHVRIAPLFKYFIKKKSHWNYTYVTKYKTKYNTGLVSPDSRYFC